MFLKEIFPVDKLNSKLLKKALKYLFLIYVANIMFFSIIHLLEIELIDRFDSFEEKESISNWEWILKFFQTVILVPILEEFSFRSYLNLKKRNIFYSIIFLSIFILLAFLNELYILSYFLSSLFVIYTILYFLRSKLLEFKYIFKILLVFSAIFFALAHINILEYQNESELIVWLSIMPMFILGIGLGLARLKNGLALSILIHTLFNLVGFLTTLL